MSLTFLISIPLLTACFIALLQPKHLKIIERGVIVSSFLQLGFILFIIPSVLSRGSITGSALFSIDALGAFLALVIALIGFFTSLYSIGYFRAEVAKEIVGPTRVRQFFLCAMLLAVSTINPVVMWIAIEATTLSTAFLISFYNKQTSTEAAWKYLIINSLGLLLGLLGTILFVAARGENSGALTWAVLQNSVGGISPAALKIAFVFIFVGYSTKVGLVPFHTWKPDTYSKAPTPIVALLSGVLLNVAFFALLRFKSVVDAGLHSAEFTSSFLIFFGLVSLVFSALLIFIQKNYKRLLAYSSIEHAGILALGFGFGGFALYAALLHMLFNSLAKALLFFSAGNIFLKYSSTKMRNVTGMVRVLPLSAPIFFVGSLAALGFPPFGLFFTEFMTFSAGINDHQTAVIIGMLSVLVIFFGFFKHLSALFFGEAPEGIAKGESNLFTQWPVLVLLALFLVLSWHIPASLDELIRFAA